MNFICTFLAAAIGGEISGLIESSGLVAKSVLVILLVFSVMSWAIIFSKWGTFRRARGARSGMTGPSHIHRSL